MSSVSYRPVSSAAAQKSEMVNVQLLKKKLLQYQRQLPSPVSWAVVPVSYQRAHVANKQNKST